MHNSKYKTLVKAPYRANGSVQVEFVQCFELVKHHEIIRSTRVYLYPLGIMSISSKYSGNVMKRFTSGCSSELALVHWWSMLRIQKISQAYSLQACLLWDVIYILCCGYFLMLPPYDVWQKSNVWKRIAQEQLSAECVSSGGRFQCAFKGLIHNDWHLELFL